MDPAVGQSRTIGPITLDMVRAARDRIKKAVIRTPLVRLNLEDTPGEVYLKLENLQPTGSFKVRGVSNAVALAGSELKTRGVYTVSAGNMAQALAWRARMNGIPCAVIVPEGAPETKLAAVRRYGAKVVQVPFDEVWSVVRTHRYPALEGSVFIHPFADSGMIAGNGTIGLEILEDMPHVDSVIVPFGGGGLATGIASAIHGSKNGVNVFACEPETASPLAASFAAGSPQDINRIPSFVDGIGGKSVLPELWNLVKSLLKGSIVVSLEEVASSVRLLAEGNRVVAEGAGAASVAAALAGHAGNGKIVCVVSGGNIDTAKLVKVLEGSIPTYP